MQNRKHRLLRAICILNLIFIFFLTALVWRTHVLYAGIELSPLSAVEDYLWGSGSFGDAPDDFVQGEEYYRAGILTDWYGTHQADSMLAYMMYRRACLTHAATAQKSWMLYGEGQMQGTVVGQTASGNILAGGYRYEKQSDTKYNSQYALQNISMLSKISGSAALLLEFVKPFVEYGEQIYFDGTMRHLSVAKLGSIALDATLPVPTATFGAPKKQSQADYVAQKKAQGGEFREYGEDWYDDWGLDSPEKVEHIISPESIIAESVRIEQRGNAQKYYSIWFDIDTKKVLSSGTTATYFFEWFVVNHLNLAAPFGVKVKYDTLSINLEVWDSGYIRSWNTNEEWTVTMLGMSASMTIATNEYYSYNPADNRFDQLAAVFS